MNTPIYWPTEIPNDLEPILVTGTCVLFHQPERHHPWRLYNRFSGELQAACAETYDAGSKGFVTGKEYCMEYVHRTEKEQTGA